MEEVTKVFKVTRVAQLSFLSFFSALANGFRLGLQCPGGGGRKEAISLLLFCFPNRDVSLFLEDIFALSCNPPNNRLSAALSSSSVQARGSQILSASWKGKDLFAHHLSVCVACTVYCTWIIALEKSLVLLCKS